MLVQIWLIREHQCRNDLDFPLPMLMRPLTRKHPASVDLHTEKSRERFEQIPEHVLPSIEMFINYAEAIQDVPRQAEATDLLADPVLSSLAHNFTLTP